MARCKRLTPTSTLAHATGWELARVNRALRDLDARAQRVGQRVQRLRGAVALRAQPLVVDDAVLAQLLAREIRRSGLNSSQAEMLQRIIRGDADEQHFTESDRLAYAFLINAGLIGESENGPELADTSLFSLGEDVANGRGGRVELR